MTILIILLALLFTAIVYAIASLINGLIIWGICWLVGIAFGLASITFVQALVLGVMATFVTAVLKDIFKNEK